MKVSTKLPSSNQQLYLDLYDCGSKPVLSRPPLCYKPLSRAGPLLQTLVADLCVEYCSRPGACRRTPPSVTNPCRDMAGQACYKANVFDSPPYKEIVRSITRAGIAISELSKPAPPLLLYHSTVAEGTLNAT